MALKNNYLSRARKEKNDEFYTLYEDIEKELSKFYDRFENKIVYCPADSSESNFPKFFKDNFEKLKLKGLYRSDIKEGYYYYDNINGEKRIGDAIDITSENFISALEKCDIVVTNPPFSLFVDFINKIIMANKEFLIIGQQNTITCKDIFKHIMDEKIFLDYGFKGIAGYFYVPKHYEDVATAGEHKEGMIRVSGVIWYCSQLFNICEERPFIELKESFYNEDGTPNTEKYPYFDDFREISKKDEDCININKVKEIPKDYFGYMGVPISFFGKYNPRQFKLIQLDHYGSELGNQNNVVNGKQVYRRIYVKLLQT